MCDAPVASAVLSADPGGAVFLAAADDAGLSLSRGRAPLGEGKSRGGLLLRQFLGPRSVTCVGTFHRP